MSENGTYGPCPICGYPAVNIADAFVHGKYEHPNKMKDWEL